MTDQQPTPKTDSLHAWIRFLQVPPAKPCIVRFQLPVHIILVHQIHGFYCVANRLQYCTLVQRTLIIFFSLGKLPGDCPIMSKTRYYLNCVSRRQRLVTRDEQKRENYLHYSILLTAYEPCKLSNESMVFILQARFACTYCSYNLQVRKKSSCVMEALRINLTCCAYLYTITLFYTNIYNIFRPNQILLEYKSWETVDAIKD